MIETAHLGADNPKLEQFLMNQGYGISDKMRGQDTIFLRNHNVFVLHTKLP